MADGNVHHLPAPVERPRVDISGGLDGFSVWLFGRPYKTGLTLTNASRIASALMSLDVLEALPVLPGPRPHNLCAAPPSGAVTQLGDD